MDPYMCANVLEEYYRGAVGAEKGEGAKEVVVGEFELCAAFF